MSQTKPNRFTQILGGTVPTFTCRGTPEGAFIAYRFHVTSKVTVLPGRYDHAYQAEVVAMECVHAARTVLRELDDIILKQKSG
jgi:hypothetical protein